MSEAALRDVGSRKLRGGVGEEVVLEVVVSVFTFWEPVRQVLDEFVCDRGIAGGRR